MSTHGRVLVGPWPGSGRAAAKAVIMTRVPMRVRRPVPHRYRAGKHGPLVLMDCRECRVPFAPDVEVPRDRLCRDCRGHADQAAPGLFELPRGVR